MYGSKLIVLVFLTSVFTGVNCAKHSFMQRNIKKQTIDTTNLLTGIQKRFQGVLKSIVDVMKETDHSRITDTDRTSETDYSRITDTGRTSETDYSRINDTGRSSNSHIFINVSFACLNDTEMVIEGIFAHDRYALRFLDADAKVPSGILQGQWLWSGDYHECINIESPYNIHTNHKFKGKYFTAIIGSHSAETLTIPQGLYISVCLPDSCELNDVKSLVNIALLSFSSSNHSLVKEVYTSDSAPIDTSDIVAIVICCVIILAVSVGTLIDIFQQRNEQTRITTNHNTANGCVNTETGPFVSSGLLADTDLISDNKVDRSTNAVTKICSGLKAFSILTNTDKLLNTSTANGPLACLNGLRVISMFWVIQGHSYGYAEFAIKDANYAVETLAGRFTFQPIQNGTYSVDTFFFLSGLLVAYLANRELSTKRRLNWFHYFFHRFWRLTAVYAFCIMFYTTILALILTGPLTWLTLDPRGPFYPTMGDCRTHWWSNLLYINNFYPNYGSQSNCMGWSWYLANDMQFYIFLSPLVLHLLHRNKKIGILFCVFLIAICIAVRASLAQYYGMNQNGDISKHKDDLWGRNGPLYTRPYARWSVYIVGMLTGYLLHVQRCKVRLNTFYTITGWVVSASMSTLVIYGLYSYNKSGTNMSDIGSIFYISCGRTAWSLSLSWLVIACATGKGGWVNSVLSWKIWAPLGRLTYGAYLVHPMILIVNYVTVVAPFPLTDLWFIYLFIGNVVLSYGAAYVISMAVEAPMMQLEKLLFNRP